MSSRQRRIVAVAVAVAIAAVVTAVLLFGVQHVPSFPDVSDDPRPPASGTIAYVTWDEGDPCLHVRPATAEDGDERVRCGSEAVGGYAFRRDGTIAVHEYRESGIVETVLDPSTLAVLSEQTLPRDTKVVDGWGHGNVNAAGDRLSVRRTGDGAWTVTVRRAGVDEVLLSLDGPDDYWVGEAWWSPDGRWVVVDDSEQRSLLVAGDGTGGTRVLAHDAQQLQWFQPGYAPAT